MNFFIFIILFQILVIIAIENTNNLENKKIHHFCGVNYLKYKITKPPSSNYKKSNSNFRRLSTDWNQIRIFVDTTFLDYQGENNEAIKPYVPSIKRALTKAVQGMTKLINVEPYLDNYFSYLNKTLFEQNKVEKWDEKINNPKEMASNYDYILLTRFEINEFPLGVLAAAMPILMHPETNRPIAGLMMVSTSPTYFAKGNIEDYFSKIFIHELTHAFGFLNDAFAYFPGGREQTLFNKTINNNVRYYIKTKKVVEVGKKYFGCDTLTGVEVEDQGTGGSLISHWESRILLGEYMTSVTYEDEMVISDFTLALLEDSGWFKPNYYTGGLLRFGKNKGCSFLTSSCIDYKNYPFNSTFHDEFFSYNMVWYPTCTTGRQSRAYNLLNSFNYIDKEYLIYLLPRNNDGTYYAGLISSADYCPVAYHLELEYSQSYFVGNCKLGNGEYGTNLYYEKPTGTENFHPNKELPEELGEKYSENSFCMMSSLVPKDKSEYSFYGTIFHPMCFPVFCSSSSLTVLIYNQYIVCPRQGGNVELEGYNGKLHCPDYNLICTGTVVCNDLFDCIEKKSLTKENTYKYDYKPISSQNYKIIEQTIILSAGELSQDGVCPIYCAQCDNKNKICQKCGSGFSFVGEKENDGKLPICKDNNILKKGYYLKDNIYYPCHAKCETCSKGPFSDSEPNCDSCKEGYILEDKNNCIEKKTPDPSPVPSPEPSPDSSSSSSYKIIIIIGVIALIVIIIIIIFIIRRKRLKNNDNSDIIRNENAIPLY